MEVPERFGLGNKPVREVVSGWVELGEGRLKGIVWNGETASAYKSGVQTWISQTLRPVLKCIKTHYNNDMDAWLQTFGEKIKTKFNKVHAELCGRQ